MHVIIGKGNLGIDLKLALNKHGHHAVILTRSGGFEWPESYPHLMELKPTHVWVTAGFGSIGECANDFAGALATHVAMPLDMARFLPDKCKLGFFSSDYVAHEDYPNQVACYAEKALTFYAMSKMWMERGLEWMDRPFTSVFRVCSLYGQHYPERTFPGKMRARFPEPCALSLPENEVTPTPTWWLAERLASNLDYWFSPGMSFHHVAPSTNTTTMEWGSRILGPNYAITSAGIDPLRPAKSALGDSSGGKADWSVLWEQSAGFFSGTGSHPSLK